MSRSRRARAVRKAAGLCLAAGLIALWGCESSAPPPGPRDPMPLPARGPVPDRPADPGYDPLFAALAGAPGSGPASWERNASWRVFAGQVDGAWRDFGSAVLAPMRAWAAGDLGEARAATTALFYPFGGPDLVTALSLFPEAAEIVLMGLEPVGNLPDLALASPAWQEAFFADLGELVSGFLKRGYFITREMNDIYSRGKLDGALPVIAFFIGRAGWSVADIRRLVPGPDGGWTETPYERLTIRPRRPSGVKIVCRRPGEALSRSVVYFSCDVENGAFRADSALYRYLAGLRRMTTFVKSGSYLLHWSSFSTLRRFILERSRFVLQDDTAIPYRFFVGLGWGVRLFGRYATPVSDFVNVEQPDLRQAYEDPSSPPTPLPFHFGYRWRTQVDNLMLAERRRPAYKVPVTD